MGSPMQEWKGSLTRIQAIEILDSATDRDDPFWENVVSDFYDEKSDTMPSIMDVFAALGVTEAEYRQASRADGVVKWPMSSPPTAPKVAITDKHVEVAVRTFMRFAGQDPDAEIAVYEDDVPTRLPAWEYRMKAMRLALEEALATPPAQDGAGELAAKLRAAEAKIERTDERENDWAVLLEIAQSTVAARERENERLLVALRTFSAPGGGMDMQAYHDCEDDVVVWENSGKAVTAGDVRNARRLVAELTKAPVSEMHFRRRALEQTPMTDPKALAGEVSSAPL